MFLNPTIFYCRPFHTEYLPNSSKKISEFPSQSQKTNKSINGSFLKPYKLKLTESDFPYIATKTENLKWKQREKQKRQQILAKGNSFGNSS